MWGLMTVKGSFREFRDEGKVADSGALSDRVDVGAASPHTGIGRRDEHLRSAAFFDVEKFLEISVIVTAATNTPSTSRPTSSS
jgi:polyisoprenoid-binding protein YceI